MLMAASNRTSRSSIQNGLLRLLPPEQLNRLLPDLHLVELPQGEMLQHRGRRVEFAYFPETAVVSFVVALEDGHMVEVGMVGNEGFVGAGAAMGDEVAAHDAMDQIPGKALRISWGKLRAAVENDPKLQAHLLRYLHAFQFQIAQTAACNGRSRR
jgi:CRP-like cAMP-binding protein